MAEFRQNPITGTWTIIAPQRGERPGARSAAIPDAGSDGGHCPFCPGHERETPPEIYAVRIDRSAPDTPGWLVRVFPNKFPAVTPDAAGVPTPESIAFAPKTQQGSAQTSPFPELVTAEPPVGQHDVLVASPAHGDPLRQYDDRQIRLVIDALRHRSRLLMQSRDLKHVAIWQNHGRAAGATIHHPHFQLLASARVPPDVSACVGRLESFARERGRGAFDALLENELTDGRRIVAANDEFVALAPWASMAAYEMWIVPREPFPFLSDLSDESLPLLAVMVRDCLRRLANVENDAAYNLIVHSGPRLLRAADHFRCFVQIVPRMQGLGGFELATGMYINSVPPEDAATALRGAS